MSKQASASSVTAEAVAVEDRSMWLPRCADVAFRYLMSKPADLVGPAGRILIAASFDEKTPGEEFPVAAKLSAVSGRGKGKTSPSYQPPLMVDVQFEGSE